MLKEINLSLILDLKQLKKIDLCGNCDFDKQITFAILSERPYRYTHRGYMPCGYMHCGYMHRGFMHCGYCVGHTTLRVRRARGAAI